MISSRERIMLINDIDNDNNQDANNDLDDLYKGYNEFHPVLDTRNLQEDEDFRQTVNKSGYGRSSQSVHRLRTGATNSTAGLAFQRSQHGLKSRRTAASRDTAGGLRTGLGTGVSRPATAVRGAGYTSQSNQNRLFDPLGLAQGSASATTGISSRSAFHLHDESTPEWKIKQLEKQINFLLDESVLLATKEKDFGQALDLAKDCVAKERSLNRLKEQSGLMETYGPNSDLTFATMFNLAERYSDAQMWSESINTYQAILKNRSFTNTGRLRMNIGEIHFRQRQYPKAIKFFRMALDQIPNTYNELRLKLMHNIGLAFVRLTQFADAIAAFEFILAERGDWDDAETVFHLIICYYALGDGDKMKYYFNKLLQVKIEDQFEERYGHHEILSNGGTIFVTGGGDSTGNSSTPVTISRISSQDRPSTSMNQHHHRSTSPVLMVHDEQDHYNNLLIEAIKNDRLRQYEKDIISKVEWSILTSAKLIAPYIEVYDHQPGIQPGMIMMIPSLDTKIQQQILNNGDFNNGQLSVFGGGGYDWCLDQIRRMATITATSTSFSFVSGLNFHHLADELELYKAVKQLRSREFDQAILTLKSFERKDRLLSSRAESGHRSPTRQSSTITNSIVPTPTGLSRLSSASVRVTSTAATNLSFLYLLQNDYESARRYADEAIAIDRYCLGAILNKGNIYYHQGDFQRAIEHYQEVIANNSTILEAYFNLALAERKLSNHDRALDALYRLRTIVRVPQHQPQQQLLQNNILNQKITNTIEVNLLYQIGLIYESMGNQDQAKDFYQKVLQLVPSDVTLLVKMADIEADDNDRKQSLHYLLEAYRYLPSHIPTIERLAAYYIEMKMYDQTIKYLEQLSIIQPNQIKWQLMIAASYRRSGNYQQALTTYQSINQRFPDNTDCLKFLIRLCSEMEQEPGVTNNHNYGLLVEQYTEQLRRLEKTRELHEEQKLTSSRSASRTSTAAGRASKNLSNSREGSAATISSNGSNGSGSSSGYMTSSMTPGTKSITPKSSPNGQKEHLRSSSSSSMNGNNNKIMKDNQVSAIVNQVVEQLDSSIERPTTSWRNRNNPNHNRNLKSSHGRQNNINNNDQINGSDINNNNGQEFYEDFLLDANIDEMLPD